MGNKVARNRHSALLKPGLLGGVEHKVACFLVKSDGVLDRCEEAPDHLLIVVERHVEWHRDLSSRDDVAELILKILPDEWRRVRSAALVEQVEGAVPDLVDRSRLGQHRHLRRAL